MSNNTDSGHIKRASISTEVLRDLARDQAIPSWIRLGYLAIANYDQNTGTSPCGVGEIFQTIGVAWQPLARAHGKAIAEGFLAPGSSVQRRVLIPGPKLANTLAVL